jgi:hypothetical protein
MNKIQLCCDYCNREIYKFKSTINKNNFCSLDCSYKFMSKNTKHNFFEKIDTEEKSYWLGFS